jgi:hypothetical protein
MTAYLLTYEDGTECSETLTFILQSPENNPEESIRLSKHGETLKSSIILLFRVCLHLGASHQGMKIHNAELELTLFFNSFITCITLKGKVPPHRGKVELLLAEIK